MSGEDQDPMEVILRTRDIPDLPFHGTLRYRGVQLVTSVLGKRSASSIKKIALPDSKEKEIINNMDLSFPGDVRVRKVRTLDKLVYTEEVAESFGEALDIWMRMHPPSENSEPGYNHPNLVPNTGIDAHEYLLYRPTQGDEYALNFGFFFVYDLIPDDTDISLTFRESEEYVRPPQNIPQNKLTGDFMVDGHGQDAKIKFNQDISFLRNLVTSPTERHLETVNVENLYDVSELKQGNLHKQESRSDVNDYCPAEVSVSNNEYVITCDHSSGPVTFRVPLTPLGTLPEWAKDRLNPIHF